MYGEPVLRVLHKPGKAEEELSAMETKRSCPLRIYLLLFSDLSETFCYREWPGLGASGSRTEGKSGQVDTGA